MKKFLILFFVFLLSVETSCVAQDTRDLSSSPKEVYKVNVNNNIKVKIGNGGAGPTGVLRFLAEDFLKIKDANYSIAWYQDISPNTLKQLQNGTIDIALVYEKEQGYKAVNEGYATNWTPIFNDHFLIVGPKSNPAGLSARDLAQEAFEKIAAAGEKNLEAIFLSRDDNSGTNVKEQSIWNLVGISPWKSEKSWYVKSHVFPKDALLQADKEELYVLTDFGTWLSNSKELRNLKIYVRGGETLVNPCFALTGIKPNKETMDFLNYLKSDRGQYMISTFGKDKFGGFALFTPAVQMDF
ncbi:MAG: substrate-binding domain-containing protein [Rickettsiales bacterium]|nr:substrate-binding domain-containing protein [Rickettsiales bacterium]